MKNVLVIEDDANSLVLITKILEYAGFNTSSADTGMQGYKSALATRPDFILLDINLPDISGEEVLEKIRNENEINTTPVIAVTSNAMIGDEKRLLASGFTGYIEKPIDPENFINQIKVMVGE